MAVLVARPLAEMQQSILKAVVVGHSGQNLMLPLPLQAACSCCSFLIQPLLPQAISSWTLQLSLLDNIDKLLRRKGPLWAQCPH